jgi:tetratricopeptide (TPR) repeat protein
VSPGDRPLLAAAIIVKNEAHHLRRCLPPLLGLCDEIVLVDTGSTDDSVAVAEEHGARVLHRPWDGDFSAARNLGLDATDAEWILYVDADEEVQQADVAAVRHRLANADQVAGFLVKFASRVGWTPYWEHRLWRHRPDVRFRGRIHETPVPDLRRIVRDEGQRFERIELFMQHYGYEGNQRAKHQRNLPMLLEQVRELPRRVYLWDHLGRVHDGLGHPVEAEAAWRQGVDVVRAEGLKESVDILVFGSLAMFLINRGEDASSIIAEGLALDPEHHTLHLALARQHMADREWLAAIAPLRALIEVGEQQEVNRSVLAYTSKMFHEWPWAMLADCNFELGRFHEAAVAYERAATEGSDTRAMQVKAIACRSLASGRRSGNEE